MGDFKKYLCTGTGLFDSHGRRFPIPGYLFVPRSYFVSFPPQPPLLIPSPPFLPQFGMSNSSQSRRFWPSTSFGLPLPSVYVYPSSPFRSLGFQTRSLFLFTPPANAGPVMAQSCSSPNGSCQSIPLQIEKGGRDFLGDGLTCLRNRGKKLWLGNEGFC